MHNVTVIDQPGNAEHETYKMLLSLAFCSNLLDAHMKHEI
ncbi:hypothetical protein T06_9375 [Trichinella sp. T6]|nr:hypothetical protein T06_9375 [Trichinella sp. T6]